MKRILFTFIAVLAAVLSVSAQKIQLPVTYGDRMVLQRGKPLRLAGRVPGGARVEVTLDTLHAEAQAGHDGRFSVTLPARPAGGPYALTFRAAGEERTFREVYVGEVWVCSGQSNMELRVSEISTAKADLALADSMPRVHLFNMESACPLTAQVWTSGQIAAVDEGRFIKPARWEMCSAQAASHFSAIGFHFGRVLADSLGCHVGLISNAVGGSTTEGWIDSLALSSRVPQMLEGDWLENPNIMSWARDRARYNLQQAKGGARKHAHPYAPGYLYHSAVRPLEAYPVRGILWYQGESNAELVKLHERLFPELERSWRAAWDDPSLPFFFVQLSSISTRPTWPAFRDSQRRLADSLAFTYMTVCSDVGDSLDVHPRRKRIVGQRLAASVLHHVYGYSDVAPSGPVPLKAVGEQGGRVRITFGQTAGGLRFAGRIDPSHFELASRSGAFCPASQVSIEGNSLVIRSSRISRPFAVRYGWRPFTRANLINAAGMPCSTFELDLDNVPKASLQLQKEKGGRRH